MKNLENYENYLLEQIKQQPTHEHDDEEDINYFLTFNGQQHPISEVAFDDILKIVKFYP